MQAFCAGGTSDGYGYSQYQNSTISDFLEKFNQVAEHNNFFDPGFSPQEMDKIPGLYKSIIEDPVALHEQFNKAKDFKFSSILKDKFSLRRFLVSNLSMPRDEANTLLASTVNTKELYRLIFGTSLENYTDSVQRVRRSLASPPSSSFFSDNSDIGDLMRRKILKHTTHTLPFIQDTLSQLSQHFHDGLIARLLEKNPLLLHNSTLMGSIMKVLGLTDWGQDKLDPAEVAEVLKVILLSPSNLHHIACDKEELLKVLIPPEPNKTETLLATQNFLCNMSSHQMTELSQQLMNDTSVKMIIQVLQLTTLNMTDTRIRVEKFQSDLAKFILFERNLYGLSAFAQKLPQDACIDNNNNGTMNETDIDGATGQPSPIPEDKDKKDEKTKDKEPVKKKTNKYAGLMKIWAAMQSTICGRPSMVSSEDIDSGDFDLDQIGLTKRQLEDIGILVHVLYSNPKILYAPNNTDADKIISKANDTFALIDTVTTYANKWLNVSKELRAYLELNTTDKNLGEIREMQKQLHSVSQIIHIENKDLLNFIDNASIPDAAGFMEQLDVVDNAACSWKSLMSGISMNVFQGFRNEEELVDYAMHRAYADNVTVFASLIFSVRKDGSLPPHVTYKIRQNATFTQTTKLVRPRYWYPGPRSWAYNYYHFGFVWIQDIIERAIINNFAGHDVVEPGNYLQQFPYPCYMYDQFLFMIEHVMPLCLTISWVYSVAMLVQNIVYEKEQRLKEVMKMMGLNNAVHWLAWFITNFVQISITTGTLTCMLKYGKVLTYSNPWIIFLTLEIFAIATIAFSFLVSVLYSKAKLAAACAGIVYFLSYVPYMYVAIREEAAGDKISFWAKSVASLMSTTAFGLGAKYFAYYEEEGVGVQWSNIYISPVEDDPYNLLMVTVMMLIDSMIYGLLVWYIENVHPGSYGLPKPWYFPFTKSYWCGGHTKTEAEQCSWRNLCWWRRRFNLSVMEEDQACAMDRQEGLNRNFESEPNHLPMGVCIDNLTKVYKTGKLAVNKLSLNLYEDQITSFLGHNGAGKTTTMSILTGLFPPTGGYATIYGHDIRSDMEEIRKSLGMCPQHNVLFDKLTVKEHIWFYARLKGMRSKDIEGEMETMIKDIGLSKKMHNTVDCLSGGMKRKLSVAIAFVAGSRTVILDEPTAGVDPYARRAIWDLLIKYKKGRTILLSTHHMDEADLLGDRIAIISNGQLKCCGSSLFLKSTFGEGYHLSLVKKAAEEDSQSIACHLNSAVPELSPQAECHVATDMSNVNETDPVQGSFITKCSESKVTAFIQQHVGPAFLKSSSARELHYILPFEEVRKGAFEKLFTALDASLESLNISSYGVMDTSLEEVFLKVAEKTGVNMSEEEANKEKILNNSNVDLDDSLPSDTSDTQTDTTNHQGDGDSTSVTDLLPERRSGDVEMGDLGAPSSRSRTSSDCSLEGVARGVGGDAEGGYSRIRNEDTISCSSEDKPSILLEGKGSYIITGHQLYLHQFISVIIKRFLYTKRNWKGLFSQILLPALFVCIAMTVALSAPQLQDLPPMVLSPAMYFNLTQPRGNFIFLANQEKSFAKPTFPSHDAPPSKLMASFRLPSGDGATCVLKSPFNNSFDADMLKRLNFSYGDFKMVSHYFNPECESVFVRGLPLENFVPPAPTVAPAKGPHGRLTRNNTPSIPYVTDSPTTLFYPYCHCAEDKTGFVCSADGFKEPHSFKAVTSDIMIDISGQNESEYILYTTDKYRLHRYGGFSFGNIREFVPENFGSGAPILFKKLAVRSVAKAWFNHKGYHSIPTYVNVLNNAILRANLPPSRGNPAAYGITVINHPMNNTNNQLSMEYILQGSDVLISIFIIVAMSFVPASFVLFLVYERSIKAKHLQFVSGLNPVVYWLGNYVWDMCNYMIPGLCIIIILRAFDIPAYVSSTNFPAVISLFLLYGWSITPMMYPVSFVFEEPSTAYISLIVINLFVGITCIVTSFLLDLFNYVKELSEIHDVLRNIFLIFPNYCLGRGLIDIAFNEYHNEYYFKTGQYDKMKSPFQWKLMVRNLVAMAAVGLAFFIITLICEYSNFFKKNRQVSMQQESGVARDDDDDDVATERKRVLRGPGKRDLIRLENITKVYKTRKLGSHLAVDKLCLGVPQGECFGLLGVNGAGKTTTFKMLTGDIVPSGGDAFLNGHSILTDMLQVQQNIGYCPQFDALYDELTAREHLQLYSRLRGVPRKDTKQVVNWALEKLTLTQYANKTSGTLSGGNRRKLSTAIALLGHPPVIFLDEPTTGMDPHSRRFLWDLVISLIKDGRSVLLTSHSMEECEALCTRLAIMVNGHFKCLGSIQHLKSRFGDGYTLTVRVKGPSYDREMRAVVRFIQRHFPEAALKEKHHNMVQYEMKSQNLSLAHMFAKMEEAQRDLQVEDYSISQNTLDNVFINFVKQQVEIVETDPTRRRSTRTRTPRSTELQSLSDGGLEGDGELQLGLEEETGVRFETSGSQLAFLPLESVANC